MELERRRSAPFELPDAFEPARRGDPGVPGLGELLEAKRACSARISVVLPARNEARTVGAIVRRLREELMERCGLVDEIVVMDSDSEDETALRARAAGAVVHAVQEVRGWEETLPGKGEAIWKSQFVTTGDLVAFLDADLVEWDAHFVSGLIAPLLTGPDVQLVKGYYDRLARNDIDQSSEISLEGGRVTELVARPLLAHHWPELSWIVQPLAGEWAVRRGVLETLELPIGYGVDLAVLLDVYARYGNAGIVQVDLGRRGHSHQSLRDLGAMATEVIGVVERRLGRRCTDEVVTLRQFLPGSQGPEAVTRVVSLRERPAAAALATPANAGAERC